MIGVCDWERTFIVSMCINATANQKGDHVVKSTSSLGNLATIVGKGLALTLALDSLALDLLNDFVNRGYMRFPTNCQLESYNRTKVANEGKTAYLTG